MSKAASVAAAALLFVAGCSDADDSADDAAAGTSGTGAGTGGASGSSGGGSSGAGGGSSGSGGGAGTATGGKGGGGAGGTAGGGPVARGAISLNVLAGCALPEGYLDFPAISGGHPVTATDKSGAIAHGAMTVDGKAAKVLCSLNGTTAIDFSGGITIGAGTSMSQSQVNAGPLAEGEPADGGALVAGAVVPKQYAAPLDGCTHTPIEFDPAAGTVWGEFTCPSFETSDGSDSCELGTSYYYFENCAL
ncbi:MAG TPA: hypothetical protein VGK73_06895 [Polyangiaceae bacterium]